MQWLATSHHSQGTENDAQLMSSFLGGLEPKPREWCHPQWAAFPAFINLIKMVSYKCAQRFVYDMVLDLIKLLIIITGPAPSQVLSGYCCITQQLHAMIVGLFLSPFYR